MGGRRLDGLHVDPLSQSVRVRPIVYKTVILEYKMWFDAYLRLKLFTALKVGDQVTVDITENISSDGTLYYTGAPGKHRGIYYTKYYCGGLGLVGGWLGGHWGKN